MKYLIVNADDFGLTEGVNNGIVESYKNGIVRSTTMLANSKAFDHGVKLSGENPGLAIGVHLALTIGKPLTSGLKTIVDSEGNFFKISVIEEKIPSFDENELETEFTAQIEKILNAGIKVTHFDSHHHVHMLPKINAMTVKLAKKYGVSIRKIKGFENDVPTTSEFSEKFYAGGVTVKGFEELINSYDNVESLETMCHPAIVDDELLGMSSYAKQRTEELNIVTCKDIKEFIESKGIKLVNYSDLR